MTTSILDNNEVAEMRWTQKQTERLIKEFENNPCLYFKGSKEDQNVAWIKVVIGVRCCRPNVTKEEVQKKMKLLRQNYNRQKVKVLRALEDNKVYKPTSLYYEKLHFLRNEPNKTEKSSKIKKTNTTAAHQSSATITSQPKLTQSSMSSSSSSLVEVVEIKEEPNDLLNESSKTKCQRKDHKLQTVGCGPIEYIDYKSFGESVANQIKAIQDPKTKNDAIHAINDILLIAQRQDLEGLNSKKCQDTYYRT